MSQCLHLINVFMLLDKYCIVFMKHINKYLWRFYGISIIFKECVFYSCFVEVYSCKATRHEKGVLRNDAFPVRNKIANIEC